VLDGGGETGKNKPVARGAGGLGCAKHLSPLFCTLIKSPLQQIAVTLASLPSSIDLPAFKRGLSPMSWVPEYAFMRPLRLSVQCHRNPLYSPECVTRVRGFGVL
jgi:hypothetical protein